MKKRKITEYLASCNRETHSSINLKLVITEELTKRKNAKIYVDFIVNKENTLEQIDEAIRKYIPIEKESVWHYYSSLRNENLKMQRSFEESAITGGDILIMTSSRRLSPFLCAEIVNDLKEDEKNFESGEHSFSSDDIEIICSTRLLDDNGNPLKNVRILSKSFHHCEALINDISSLWNKSGLKFKCGRTVLHSEKTFEELGITSGRYEVEVTGGRL
jgi:hypothetical protein